MNIQERQGRQRGRRAGNDQATTVRLQPMRYTHFIGEPPGGAPVEHLTAAQEVEGSNPLFVTLDKHFLIVPSQL